MITLCKKAGVKYFRYHAFRHFGASTLDNANVNIGEIQRILGHENRSTTEIYLHSIGEGGPRKLKSILTETLNEYLRPLRKNRTELENNEDYILTTLSYGRHSRCERHCHQDP
jgi:tryptophanyl-tRNA synthetase